MAQAKMRCHVAAHENAAWHTRVHVWAYVYACVYARVRVYAINKNKHPFQDFRYLINHSPLIYPPIPFNFCHVGLCFSILVRK